MSKEAMKLALEALGINNKAWKALADSGDAGFWEAEEQPFYELSVKAITALREALAEQPAQQEPVATITITQRWSTRTIDNHFEDCVCDWPDGEYKLYTSPQPAQQEPVAGVVIREGLPTLLQDRHIKSTDQRLYTPPPPAQRKPLTDEQIVAKALHLSGLGTSPDVIQFARAIEAAHGIKEKIND